MSMQERPASVASCSEHSGWALDRRVVRASWSGFSYAASTDFTRVGTDLIRDNSIWNESLYFWYRRMP